MNARLFGVLVWNEMRLRLRRTSTLVALLVVASIGLMLIPDPAGGRSMIVVEHARMLYTSAALALGSAIPFGLIFTLGSFYLVRGRVGEDIRSGVGLVIGASRIGSAQFVFSRWLGALLYLLALAGAFTASMLFCHLLRSSEPLALWVYLSTYILLLLPALMFSAACATLFDSFAPLMGKAGDVLYFFVWIALCSFVGMLGHDTDATLRYGMAFDFSGVTIALSNLKLHLHTNNIAIGSHPFDARLAPLLVPNLFWSAQAVALRCAAAVLALLPLAPACVLFHRYSPDRVKASSARLRRSPLALLDSWLRPLSRLSAPLFRLAGALPGLAGQVLADVALTLAASPSAVAALIAALAGSLLAPTASLGAVLTAIVAFWGVLVADLSTRDFQASALDMTGALPGGAPRRYARQLAATMLIGLMFVGVIALRWSVLDPLRAGALLAGVVCVSAVASLLGRCTGTPRTFVALFMLMVYLALSAHAVPAFDVLAFNGSATAGTALAVLGMGVLAALAGVAYNRRVAHSALRA